MNAHCLYFALFWTQKLLNETKYKYLSTKVSFDNENSKGSIKIILRKSTNLEGTKNDNRKRPISGVLSIRDRVIVENPSKKRKIDNSNNTIVTMVS